VNNVSVLRLSGVAYIMSLYWFYIVLRNKLLD